MVRALSELAHCTSSSFIYCLTGSSADACLPYRRRITLRNQCAVSITARPFYSFVVWLLVGVDELVGSISDLSGEPRSCCFGGGKEGGLRTAATR